MNTLTRMTALLILTGMLVGCGNEVTLEVDLPENFRYTAEVKYRLDSADDCWFGERENLAEMDRFGMKSTEFYNYPIVHKRQIPLSKWAKGCRLKLKAISFEVWGKWEEGDPFPGQSQTFAGISVVNKLYPGYQGMPESGIREFEGQCWYRFRTMPHNNSIAKIMRCDAVDDTGAVKKGTPGGAVQWDQIAGKTIRYKVSVSDKTEPYIEDTWVRFPNGWKRCVGKGPDDPRGYCDGNVKDFKTFIMDGRECTIYPGCTE